MNIRMKKSNVINTLFYDFFLQNDDVANSYWFSYKFTINITFLLTNNHLSHYQFVKKIVK